MIMHAAVGNYDTAILVSNDGDFSSVLHNLKKLGKRTEALFFKGYTAESLRQNCDIIRRARKSYFKPI